MSDDIQSWLDYKEQFAVTTFTNPIVRQRIQTKPMNVSMGARQTSGESPSAVSLVPSASAGNICRVCGKEDCPRDHGP